MGAAAHHVGRYVLHGAIGGGATATVHVGRLVGPVGFSRTVAVKRLHGQLSKEPEFVAMFLDEARLTSCIRHPNVAATLDVVNEAGELFLVMEYVHGESLARLVAEARDRGEAIPPRIAASIVAGVLHGLHAAHEARSANGKALDIVHRDVSPQNVLVGVDGTARIVDFGVAKATERVHATRDGRVKGKLAYMAPEQFRGRPTRQSDVYGAAVLLWEALAGSRLFAGENDTDVAEAVLSRTVEKPSSAWSREHPAPDGVDVDALDAVVLKGLDRDPGARFGTAREMAIALETCVRVATAAEVGDWVASRAGEALSIRAGILAEAEATPAVERASERVEPNTAPEGVAAPPPRRAKWVAWIVAATLPLAAWGAFHFTSSAPRANAPEAAATSGAAPVKELALAETEANASALPEPPAPKLVAAPKPNGRAATPTPPAKSRRKDACNPPYVFDATGRKEYKVECLH